MSGKNQNEKAFISEGSIAILKKKVIS